MEALYAEAAYCTRGEERARALVEAIRGMVGEDETNDWLTRAVSLAQQAVFELETQAIVVDGLIEAGASTAPPFHCQPLAILEVLEANFSTLAAPEDKGPRFDEASQKGDAILVDLLIQAGMNPSANDNRAIREASKNGHFPVVERLLQDECVDPSAKLNWAIRSASSNGYLSIVERLLQDARVDPSALQNEAIREASINGHLPVVERLLQDARVDPSARSNISILLASKNGHLQVVERLLQDERVDPTAFYNTAIQLAFENGHLPVMKRLLQDERVLSTLSAKGLAVYYPALLSE